MVSLSTNWSLILSHAQVATDGAIDPPHFYTSPGEMQRALLYHTGLAQHPHPPQQNPALAAPIPIPPTAMGDNAQVPDGKKFAKPHVLIVLNFFTLLQFRKKPHWQLLDTRSQF